MIVVETRGETRGDLFELSGTIGGQPVQSTRAVQDEELTVLSPVRRLEVPILGVDRINSPGRNLYRQE